MEEKQGEGASRSDLLGRRVAFDAPGGRIVGRVMEQALSRGAWILTIRMDLGGEAYVRADEVRLLAGEDAGA